MARRRDQIYNGHGKDRQTDEQAGQEEIPHAAQHGQQIPVSGGIIGNIIGGQINADLVLGTLLVTEIVVKVAVCLLIVPAHTFVSFADSRMHRDGKHRRTLILTISGVCCIGRGFLIFLQNLFIPQKLRISRGQIILVLLQPGPGGLVHGYHLAAADLTDGIAPAVGPQIFVEDI